MKSRSPVFYILSGIIAVAGVAGIFILSRQVGDRDEPGYQQPSKIQRTPSKALGGRSLPLYPGEKITREGTGTRFPDSIPSTDEDPKTTKEEKAITSGGGELPLKKGDPLSPVHRPLTPEEQAVKRMAENMLRDRAYILHEQASGGDGGEMIKLLEDLETREQEEIAREYRKNLLRMFEESEYREPEEPNWPGDGQTVEREDGVCY